MMKRFKDGLILSVKGILFIYLPIILSIFFIYKIIFKSDMDFFWERILIFAFPIIFSTVLNYSENKIEEDVQNFNSLKNSITKDKWEIVEESENRLIVKPKFNFPLRLLIDDKVQIDYSEENATIKGPWYYINRMVKDINGSSNVWGRRIINLISLILLMVLISIPILRDKGLIWEVRKSVHNSMAKNINVIEINPEDVIGNTVQNTNNYGYGAENDDYIFYVEDNLNLVRTNKDYKDKIYLIKKPSGTGISRLNLLGDWIYYTSGKGLNRIRIDVKDNETIYKLGYLSDINMKGNDIYFINYSDNDKIYKMDINGRNLQTFLDVSASDIAIYEDEIIVSYSKRGKNYVKSFDFNGSEKRIELETLVYNLVKWEGYYYFIGEDYKLYKNKADGTTDPEVLVDHKVSSYFITEAGIFYSSHSEDAGYPGKDIFKINLDGTENTLLISSRMVGGFARLGDFIIYTSSDDNFFPTLKRLNIYTNKIESME